MKYAQCIVCTLYLIKTILQIKSKKPTICGKHLRQLACNSCELKVESWPLFLNIYCLKVKGSKASTDFGKGTLAPQVASSTQARAEAAGSGSVGFQWGPSALWWLPEVPQAADRFTPPFKLWPLWPTSPVVCLPAVANHPPNCSLWSRCWPLQRLSYRLPWSWAVCCRAWFLHPTADVPQRPPTLWVQDWLERVEGEGQGSLRLALATTGPQKALSVLLWTHIRPFCPPLSAAFFQGRQGHCRKASKPPCLVTVQVCRQSHTWAPPKPAVHMETKTCDTPTTHHPRPSDSKTRWVAGSMGKGRQ